MKKVATSSRGEDYLGSETELDFPESEEVSEYGDDDPYCVARVRARNRGSRGAQNRTGQRQPQKSNTTSSSSHDVDAIANTIVDKLKSLLVQQQPAQAAWTLGTSPAGVHQAVTNPQQALVPVGQGRGQGPRFPPRGDSNRPRITCFYCGRLGHGFRSCHDRAKALAEGKTLVWCHPRPGAAGVNYVGDYTDQQLCLLEMEESFYAVHGVYSSSVTFSAAGSVIMSVAPVTDGSETLNS